jgi:hypothetical protein
MACFRCGRVGCLERGWMTSSGSRSSMNLLGPQEVANSCHSPGNESKGGSLNSQTQLFVVCNLLRENMHAGVAEGLLERDL